MPPDTGFSGAAGNGVGPRSGALPRCRASADLGSHQASNSLQRDTAALPTRPRRGRDVGDQPLAGHRHACQGQPGMPKRKELSTGGDFHHPALRLCAAPSFGAENYVRFVAACGVFSSVSSSSSIVILRAQKWMAGVEARFIEAPSFPMPGVQCLHRGGSSSGLR